MKKLALYTSVGLIVLAAVAWAAPEKIQSDLLQFGRKASVADKVIEIEQNAGANNPKITSTAAGLDFKFFSKLFTWGRGLAEDVRLVVNRGGSNPELKWDESSGAWEFSNDGSTFNAIGSGGAALPTSGGVLINVNAGFEDGVANWTASGGTFTSTTTAADVGFDVTAGSWDASAASQTLSNDLVTIPAGLFGKVCSLTWVYKGGDANLKAQVYDGTSVIAESAVFSAHANYSEKQYLFFTCPSSGQIRARFFATADAAIVYLDEVRLGQELYAEAFGWHIDAQIGGARVYPSTGSVASYTELTDPGLDLVLRSFSATAEIPCSTTNASSGLTCSSGDESVGIAFIPPKAGLVEVCAAFSHAVGHTGTVFTTFQWVQTPNNAQTINDEGGARVTSGTSNSPSVTISHHPCGVFLLTDTSKATFRLMYEQVIGGGAPTTNYIWADRDAIQGQTDIHITARML